jgi:hypothetical protein
MRRAWPMGRQYSVPDDMPARHTELLPQAVPSHQPDRRDAP